jgi:ubiquinone/menaquinone biosynthesis C-methylase UbiE
MTTDLINQFIQANEHRDFGAYTKAMDAALDAKAQALFPHFGDIHKGDRIVDAGAGTGKLAAEAARVFTDADVIALDISPELLREARKIPSITTQFGNAVDQNFPDNSIKVKYFSTSGHEIESFGGQGSMRIAVRQTFRELVPEGRIIIRDFAKPSLTKPIYMKILTSVGGSKYTANHAEIAYNLLSTRALFERFHTEFKKGSAFDYSVEYVAGEEYIKLLPEWAHEFYLRKDYTGNWKNEIKEKYTYWTLEDAYSILAEEGFAQISVIPELNEYIYLNRLQGKIALFEIQNTTIKPLAFPPTHMVIVATKP